MASSCDPKKQLARFHAQSCHSHMTLTKVGSCSELQLCLEVEVLVIASWGLCGGGTKGHRRHCRSPEGSPCLGLAKDSMG
jgi:hypothetical protein